MPTVNRLSAEELRNLDHDGATVGLPDGRTLRLRLEPDEYMSLMDEQGPGVWCGRLEWVRASRDYVGSWGTRRPDGFDGLARVVDRDGGARLWWQPPGADIIGPIPWDDATMRQEEARIRELLRFGYAVAVLEVVDGTDAYGRDIVREYEALGGVEWDADGDYLAEIAGELAAQLEALA